jgi:uncharacterized glyoxalase superfamily protein PhnB
MKKYWKPDGYNCLSPYLTVENAEVEIDFLKSVFNAEILRKYTRPDGSISHIELRFLDSVLMLGQATASWKSTHSQLHIYVSDVTEVFGKAIAAGGIAIADPSKKDGDPDRRGGVRDPAGNVWWIATQETE